MELPVLLLAVLVFLVYISAEHLWPKPRRRDARSGRDSAPLLFYKKDEPYYEFTNFSPHPIQYQGKLYPTSEHLFQAYKFLSTRPDLAERVRTTPTPRAALEEATRMRKLQRSDWFDVNISVMDQVLEAKFTQNAQLKKLLLDTGERDIIEDSPVDSFWGCGADGQGRNELGKALVRLRKKFRRQGRQHR
ncbi:uncharacterized protein PHACADRAFT_100358 [Phanerochaete carnosa HHB-10118-sp]|uniref:NADAR domain-containing protein n=1 Tax=Phanerochaete carnosa (strain HHB-10118-sp) TaxID=650164 RepID=K5VM96_PHACS|nr:uncharacterized protein PHACADRAFT_100358 [Phanerochaete carnosa HHB-10118-sp]EKM52578.1 hypothetical protein PHACADRAFT_100358 [Phanerochaete carnosa HHB-10118-sp]